MANSIKMTPEQMEQKINEYKNEGEKVQEVINAMDKLLQQLQEEWEGQASQAYAAKFGELRPGFVKAQELIMEIASALTAAKRTIMETDSSIASSFR